MKVLVVEDEMLVAEDLKDILEELDHEVVGMATNSDEAEIILETKKVDVALLDIRIEGTKTGIDLATIINEKYSIPFMFLSAHSDKNTLTEASHTNPANYLVKPIRKESLFAALMVLQTDSESISKPNNYTFKEKDYSIDIEVGTIGCIKAEGSYVKLYTEQGEYVLSKGLKNILEEEAFSDFIRVHKSYAVNPIYVAGENSKEVILSNGKRIPLGRGYK